MSEPENLDGIDLPTKAELAKAFPEAMAHIHELESYGLSFDEIGETLVLEAIAAAKFDPERIAQRANLSSLGFTQVDEWLFAKDGKTYNLSFADLSQIERIEREGMFLVELEANPDA